MGDFTRKTIRKSSYSWDAFEKGTSGNPFNEGETYFNNLYQVTVQEHDGGWTWLSIVRRDRSAMHDWRELQRVKNEICGPEREAVELYPAESRLVDTSNQFHLWVMPAGMTFPFGYRDRDVSDYPVGKHRQRPFREVPDDLNKKERVVSHTTVLFPKKEE